ncbi:hypothetical protein V2S84_17200 [Azotobacter chroococcum]|nr:hypothetical protein [Azotobacter chroococcum]
MDARDGPCAAKTIPQEPVPVAPPWLSGEQLAIGLLVNVKNLLRFRRVREDLKKPVFATYKTYKQPTP